MSSADTTFDYRRPPLVTREDWNAKLPRLKGLLPLVQPVQNVVVHYYTGATECFRPSTCTKLVQRLQKQAMEDRTLCDIPYNFMIGHDVRIYEGRGWDVGSDKTLPEPDLWGNRYDIAILGNWLAKTPHKKVVELAVSLIRHAVAREYVEKRYRIIHMRDVPVNFRHIKYNDQARMWDRYLDVMAEEQDPYVFSKHDPGPQNRRK